MKYSYRFYVDGVRIDYKNLKTLLSDHGFDKIKMYDMSIYERNKVLFLPLTTQKEKGCEVPELKLCNTADIFKCCASYIQEDFEDCDLKFPDDTPKAEPVITKAKIEDDGDEDESPNKYNRLSGLIKLLSSKRSDCFDTRIELTWCIINLCNKEKISRR
jgi:hypothetical protein